MKPFIPMAFVAIAIGCLAGCSESPPESSSDAFSGLANVHEVDAVIEDTALIDERLIAQNADGNWGASVFETETVLTERPEGTASAPILADICTDRGAKSVLWRPTCAHRVLIRWLRYGNVDHAV